MTSTDGLGLACALVAGLALALPAGAKPPLSASDWLSVIEPLLLLLKGTPLTGSRTLSTAMIVISSRP